MARTEGTLRPGFDAVEVPDRAAEDRDAGERGALARLPWIPTLIIAALVVAALAAPLIAGPGSGVARSRLAMISTTVYGSALVLFAVAPWYGLAIVGLLLCGGAYLAIASTLNTTIQLQVDEGSLKQILAQADQGTLTSRALAAYPAFLRGSAVGPLANQLSELIRSIRGARSLNLVALSILGNSRPSAAPSQRAGTTQLLRAFRE